MALTRKDGKRKAHMPDDSPSLGEVEKTQMSFQKKKGTKVGEPRSGKKQTSKLMQGGKTNLVTPKQKDNPFQFNLGIGPQVLGPSPPHLNKA